ncbi:short chain dehydrogenase family protein [Pseudarthrobacter siccitolerans]|uniref:Short chain dehydrogenase family protein n=1 Tax=Pseudarthrobacter siccitolerans TaxID=861266 RepID=A0A024H442_9MICC|nr:glucose 1-dehydrogenase [Pseudarthrobacter siccitolerans]CCQ46524.1 short chain dehydrogenase family protein [Pseudarthrobacter siccitolerans]
MGRLANKVAIITGGSGGIGEALVKLFAHEGARVLATGRNEARLNELVSDLNRQLNSERVFGVTHEITSESDWANVVAKAVEVFGQLDILVNNAAIPGRASEEPWDVDAENATTVLTTNIMGAILGIKAAMPELKKSGAGSIVNVSSAAAFVGGVSGGSVAYASSKAAVGAVSREIALGVARDGVRVNTVYPGLVRTPILENFPQERIARTLSKIPMGFAADPIDIAYGVLYLASDESRFMTGADLVIDGGHTAQ